MNEPWRTKTKPRLKLTDTVHEAAYKMSEGNPGALTAFCEIVKHGAEIDPYTDPLLLIMWLDEWGIYGARFYMLWNDVCNRNLSKTIACIRAKQMGRLDMNTLQHAIDNRGDGLDLDAVCKAVLEELPKFKLS